MDKQPHILFRANRILRRTAFNLCKILLVVQVLATTVTFMGRYVFGYTPPWGEATAVICFVWISLLGAGLAIRGDLHMKMTVTESFLPTPAIKAMDAVANLGILVFAVFMLVGGIQMTLLAAKNILPGLYIKSSWLYVSLPVAGVISLLSLLGRLDRRGNADAGEDAL